MIQAGVNKLVIALREFGINAKTARDLANLDPQVCWNQIKWIRLRSPKNTARTLMNAIQENWVEPEAPPEKAMPLSAPYHSEFVEPPLDVNAQADFERQLLHLSIPEVEQKELPPLLIRWPKSS